MEQLNKEQLLKVKEQLTKVMETISLVAYDYQTRLDFVKKTLANLDKTETPSATVIEKVSEPAESKKN